MKNPKTSAQAARKRSRLDRKNRKRIYEVHERERNRLVWEANRRFIQSGIKVRDVYGVLEN